MLFTFKDVELVVEPTVVQLVEDLHPHKRVKHNGIQLQHLILIMAIVAEDLGAGKVKCEHHDQLQDRLSNDHLPHLCECQLGKSRDRSHIYLR